MRRLPLFTISLCSHHHRSPSKSCVVSLSFPLTGGPDASSTLLLTEGLVPSPLRATGTATSVLTFGVAGFATTGAASVVSTTHASSPHSPSFHFTSFELESELLWAQEDLCELHTLAEVTAAAPTPPTPLLAALPSSTPTLSPLSSTTIFPSVKPAKEKIQGAAGLHIKQVFPAAPRRVDGLTSAPPIPASCPLLPSLLRCPRWRSVDYRSFDLSTPGYVEEAQEVLTHLHAMWELELQQRQLQKIVSSATQFNPPPDFTISSLEYLREAHTEALLVLMEFVVASPSTFIDASQHPFQLALLSCLLQLMSLRHIELAGRHMAQVSRLLLGFSPLFADVSHYTEVWHSYLLLCYSTRRRLRRKHNCDCLEALLWGLYHPRLLEERREKRSNHAYAAISVAGALSEVANVRDVRRATLHHLIYRCLETESTTTAATREKISIDATAHVDLVLSWSLLLASEDLESSMRDAIVHRLCKSLAPSEHQTGKLIPASVQQWKRLALRRAEAKMVLSDGKSTHGRHGKALCPGPAVYTAVEQQARRSGGWSMLTLDRHLLAVLCSRQEPPRSLIYLTGTMSAPLARVTPYVSQTVPTQAKHLDYALRLADAATATLGAYARLRWGPLDAKGNLSGSTVAARRTNKIHTAAPALSLRALQQRQAACQEEVVELVHTAHELPKQAWCLSEAIAVRLVQCLRLCDAYRAVAAATALTIPSSPLLSRGRSTPPVAPFLSQRQLVAAFRRLARHSRINVLTRVVVLQSEWHSAKMPSEEAAGQSAGTEDPFQLSAFTAQATLVLVRQLRSADEVVQLLEAWRHERAAAVTPLSADVLRRLRGWVEALPPQLRFTKLPAVLAQVAGLPTSVPSPVFFGEEQRLSVGRNDNANTAEGMEMWNAIIAAAAAPQLFIPNERSPLLAPSDPAVMTKVNSQETLPTVSNARPDSTSSVHDAAPATPQACSLLHRLRWMALLNVSVRLEWQWSGARHPTADYTQNLPVWTEPYALVEASEAKEITAAERTRLEALCRHCFASWKKSMAAASAAARQEWQWLDRLLVLCNPVTDPDALSRESPMSSLHPKSTELVVLAVKTARSFDGVATGNTSQKGSLCESPLFLSIHYDEALRSLASYCAGLTMQLNSIDDELQNGAAFNKLCLATAAFAHCLIAFWHMHSRVFLTLPSPLGGDLMDFGSVLCEYYEHALQLYQLTTSNKPNLAFSPLHLSSVAASCTLPSFPDDLHVGVFRLLTQTEAPDWQQCEKLLLLADDVAVSCATNTEEANGKCRASTATNSYSSIVSRQIPFELPLRVYADTVASYVAHNHPIPQQLYERCMRKL